MKDLTIKANTLRRELLLLTAGFMLATGLNIYSIIKYNTEWKELFTQLHIIILIGLFIYFITVLFRLIGNLIINIFRR